MSTHVKITTKRCTTISPIDSLWASVVDGVYQVGDVYNNEPYGLDQEEAKRIYALLEARCVQ